MRVAKNLRKQAAAKLYYIKRGKWREEIVWSTSELVCRIVLLIFDPLVTRLNYFTHDDIFFPSHKLAPSILQQVWETVGKKLNTRIPS